VRLLAVFLPVLLLPGQDMPARPDAPTTRPVAPSPIRLSRTRGAHARLIVRADEVAPIRRRCGIAGDGEPESVADLARLKSHAERALAGRVDPGGLYPIAFMHLVTGVPGTPDRWTQHVERELMDAPVGVLDFDDVAVALDWCWDALDEQVRATVAERWVDVLQPLRESDNLLEHVLINPRLCHLAIAIALRDAFIVGTPQGDRVADVITAGRKYLTQHVAALVEQLGGDAPTPGIRAELECDLMLAIELWRAIEPATFEKPVRAAVGALDAYVWGDPQWPRLSCGLVHDAGQNVPRSPGEGAAPLAPALAEWLAGRTGSPVAAHLARVQRSATAVTAQADAQRTWMRLALGSRAVRPLAVQKAPLARRLGNGWVLMRSDWGPGSTVIGFDAGQAFWLANQHLDAGQFQVIRKGRLALDSGDDVEFAASAARGGEQRLGDQRGDFRTYAESTPAHNCVVLLDLRAADIRVGKQWLVVGNQRRPAVPVGPPPPDLARSARGTGRLLAFETNPIYSFARADLARAWGTGVALVYERSLLFLHDGLLLVVDRVETARPQVRAAFMLQLPAAPRIAGEPLKAELRRRMSDENAGSWTYAAEASWLDVADGGGRMFVRSLSPARRRWHIVGGPGTVLRVSRGPSAGRAYVGSSATGFEYWMTPAMMPGGVNAWYRLGNPGTLGSAFGAGSGWGRLEVESLETGGSHLFVHALAIADADIGKPPPLDVVERPNGLIVRTTMSGREYTVSLTPAEASLGRVMVRDVQTDRGVERELTSRIEPDAPLPLE